MQASLPWTPPSGTLGRLVAEARERAASLAKSRSALEKAAADAPAAPSFAKALRRPEVAVIAEMKRRSPSKGAINAAMHVVDQAQAYARGGAAALSVLTETSAFGGTASDLSDVRAAIALPLLKKDFHVDPVQALEARALGASAMLLIARAVDATQLELMMRAASDAGVEALVEVRDEAELARALDGGATLIGINNRDLETLIVHAGTAERLMRLVPANVIAIAESGVASREDVERAGAAGSDAVLVGSSLSASADPAAAVRALTGVRRAERSTNVAGHAR